MQSITLSFESPQAWIVQPLSSAHDRTLFDCGIPAMNLYLREHAGQNAKKDIARTFVAVQAAHPSRIGGYYSLTLNALQFDALPREKQLPRYPIPVAHLGRLAVDAAFQGQKLGKRLLLDAFVQSEKIAELAGCYAVEVVALDDAAAGFYRKYGFVPLADDPLHLYTTLKSIRKLGLL